VLLDLNRIFTGAFNDVISKIKSKFVKGEEESSREVRVSNENTN